LVEFNLVLTAAIIDSVWDSSGLALAGCAYLAKTGPSYLPATVVGRHRQAILAASAVLSLSVLGFTKLAIMPTVNKLKAIEKKIIKGE